MDIIEIELEFWRGFVSLGLLPFLNSESKRQRWRRCFSRLKTPKDREVFAANQWRVSKPQ